MSRHSTTSAEIHPAWCGCDGCRPTCPADRAANTASLAAIAGSLTGLALAFFLDRAIGGPGILCIFGF